MVPIYSDYSYTYLGTASNDAQCDDYILCYFLLNETYPLNTYWRNALNDMNFTYPCSNLILPVVGWYDARETCIEVKYNRGNFDQSFTIQLSDNFDYSDFAGSPLSTIEPEYLYVTERNDMSRVQFTGTVETGSSYDATNGG